MRQILKATALAALLLPGIAAAQVPQFPQNLPANTVVGRLGTGAGPSQAIPFSVLSSRLTGASITLNSGNGQTAPGAMSGGNTFSFGANTDTPRFAGIGLGGAAPATGLEIYNAPGTPSGNGQGFAGASAINGGVFLGQGSTYDAALANKSGAIALGVTTNTQDIVLGGKMTAASLATAGTIAGALCATSTGLILYEAGVNCYAVSGITVVSGKTLTVDNSLELAGTDGTKFTFPGASDTVETLAATQTISGTKTFSGTLNITGTGQIGGTAFGTFATQNFATPPAIGGTTPAAGAFSTLTATTPLGLSSGGTNASTAPGARASGGINVESYTPKGDTNYTILATDRTVGTSGSLTAPRTWTLPAASSVNPGQDLVIVDMAGGVTNTNTLTISRGGSDTINGGTSVAINVSNGGYLLRSDGTSKWTAQQLGAQATVGVSSINGQTGNPSIVAGTGISVSTSGGNISVANTGITAIFYEPGTISNCTLAASVASNNLTISLKTQAGADPSAGSPCTVSFRNVTLTTGDYTPVNVTSATSFTVNAGSSFGTSNSTPFKLRVFAVNNAGAVVLSAGVLSGPNNFFAKSESVLQSTTACSACATATAVGTLYSTAAQTSKAVRELGWMAWDNGLTTAGTWASGPTMIQMAAIGYRRAGEPTGNAASGSVLNANTSYTSASYVTTALTVSITPTSKSNYISCTASGPGLVASASASGFYIIQRGGVNVGPGFQIFGSVANMSGAVYLAGTDAPASTSSLTYAVFVKSSTAGLLTYFPNAGYAEGGALISCWEIAG